MSDLQDKLSPTTRKNTGAHFTPPLLSAFVASQIMEACKDIVKGSARLRMIDPAVGDGELLYALLKQASKRALTNLQVTGYDINPEAVSATSSLINGHFPGSELDLQIKDFLDDIVIEDSLFSRAGSNENFDIAIANPPYVRTQVLGATRAQRIARNFKLTGRTDLYHAFILGIERILVPGGIAGIIVSNRFMTTKSGQAVRRYLLDKFEILHVWDFGDTRLFEAAVLPAVLLLRKKAGNKTHSLPRFTSIYLSGNKPPDDPQLVFSALATKDSAFFDVRDGYLDAGDTNGDVWRVSTRKGEEWLAIVKRHTKATFRDLGKIRVGVKTTADNIFIIKNTDESTADMPETARPLITHHIARRYKAGAPGRKIVYTHEMDHGIKKPVDLSKYPRTKRYLESHKAELSKRTYVMDSGRNWFEIWVPQNPDSWRHPKLVFRDIVEHPVFWVDLNGYIVNGDCYWLQFEKENEFDLLWLALAVANSTFIEEFYDRTFHNKLYSGRRRFITQYVEKFPLPDPHTRWSKEIIELTKKIYDLPLEAEFIDAERRLNSLVYSAFGLPEKKSDGSGI